MAGFIEQAAEAIWGGYNQGRAAVVSDVRSPVQAAQWSAVMDNKTCDWCAWADERIFDPKIEPYDPPVHYGCRCIVAYILADEVPPELTWGSGPPKSSFPPGSTKKPNELLTGSQKRTIEMKDGDLIIHDEDLVRLRDQGPSAIMDTAWSNDPGDVWLTEYGEKLGYGAKPKVMTQAEFAEYAKGRTILNRGVAGTWDDATEGLKLADQFRYGDYWQGNGVYGNGTYTAYGSMGEGTAGGYGKGKIRMILKDDARVIKHNDLRKLQNQTVADLMEKARDPNLTAAELETLESTTMLMQADEGRFATWAGYDAIDVEGARYMVVLNRSAVVVEEKVGTGLWY